ncbi:PDT-domain-containing protein [Artomyces pyxidatus]|uniref:PDT-domain-containing protein n=1 Tax=Artomyces pyxidatus TaxID=48021 RepID=A0ACB8TIX1_9AGAM|nr:PDT-domain-containing protein [Artomyces pyxidatus]
MTIINGTELPKLAFLGPVGTYSHQAAYDKFADSVEYHARQTIADVFDSVNAAFQLALLPQENSIFGVVTETYDLLRSPEVGKTKWIRGAVTLPVQHCLVVRQGQTLQSVRRVLSHEQALGQCKQFLAPHDSAAICSKLAVRLLPGLAVLREGIQNVNNNFTRFYVMGNSTTIPPCGESGRRAALVRIEVEAGSSVSITRLLTALRLPAARIDRRPSVQPGLSQSVYFVEVEEAEHAGNEEQWSQCVRDAVRRANEAGGRTSLLGTW